MGRRSAALTCALAVLAAGCSADDETAEVGSAAGSGPPALAAGEERTFAPGAIEAGDTLRCAVRGFGLKVVVPEPRQHGLVSESTNAWRKDGSQASLQVDVWSNGRAVASCS